MYMIVRSGSVIDLGNLDPDCIHIEDIAHSLSMLCRFGGHTSRFYSVAQHSIRVSQCLPQHLKMAGLLHDAAEAYLQDIPRPLKRLIPEYERLETDFWRMISARFDLPLDLPYEVKLADDRALITEFDELFSEEHSALMLPDLVDLQRLPFQFPLSPTAAKIQFLKAFNDYANNR